MDLFRKGRWHLGQWCMGLWLESLPFPLLPLLPMELRPIWGVGLLRLTPLPPPLPPLD